ncbi:MAG TPA: thermonuclease family protein, partial [Bradyrhizobium sp.]|nr:thermonuclease family protein [Bradyrhizobium sp.]
MEKQKGILTVTGTIDSAQFWPKGLSDADTAKIIVRVTGASSFSFQKAPGAPAKPTNAFAGAFMKGSDSIDKKTGKKRKPKMVINSKSQITIRLQGIDAPELHFRPPSGHINLRQHFGESATIALATFLKSLGASPIPCRVVTRVNKPNDVFDKYGRFIGDILVRKGAKEINVNHWLVEQGWAFPSFYDSMMVQE